MHRFFAPALDIGDETVVLPRAEGEHLTRVLRLGIGDTVAVFDGRGHEFLATVAGTARRDVRLRLVSQVAAAQEPSVALTLVQAVLKTDKMDEIVRDAVMLGVRAIQPIVSARSETTVATLLRSTRVERWRRVALASVKQSKRAVLPEVRMPLSFDTFLEEPAEDLRLMLVEPGVDGDLATLAAVREQPTPGHAAVLVGPEGGWIEREWNAARAHGALLITLGHRTLRADAVPVAAISVLQFLWGDL